MLQRTLQSVSFHMLSSLCTMMTKQAALCRTIFWVIIDFQRASGKGSARYLKPMSNFLSTGCSLPIALSSPSSTCCSTTLLSANSLFRAARCCTSAKGALLLRAKVSQKGALTTSCLVRPGAGSSVAVRFQVERPGTGPEHDACYCSGAKIAAQEACAGYQEPLCQPTASQRNCKSFLTY